MFTAPFCRYSILFLLGMFSAFGLKAESKRDTLINKAWRDTFRVQKAQVFDTESDGSMLYYRPKPFKFAKNVPSDIYLMGKTAFSKKNLPKLGAILAGSALLVLVDQPRR